LFYHNIFLIKEDKNEGRDKMKKEKAKSTIIVTIEDRCYTWNGNLWYGPDFIKPPAMIIAQLNEFMKTNSKAVDVARPVKSSPLMSTPKKTIKKATPNKKAVKKIVRKVKTNHGKIGKKLAKKNLTNASGYRQTAKAYPKKDNVPLKIKQAQVKKVKSKK
jgi:hypothetical protein